MIDLAELKAIAIDPERATATAEGGVLWRELNDAAAKHGLAVTGGAVSGTGIAGYTLGGGLGWLMAKYGLAADNLLAVELVTAAGEVLEVDAGSHPDLFWALRGGGGGNFGIVTRFIFRTHPVGDVATYTMEWPWSDAKKVVQAWQKLAPHAPDGLFSVLNLSAVVGGRTRITSAGQFFGSPARLRQLLQPLVNAAAPTRFSVTSRSYLDAQEMWAGCSGSLEECHLPPQGTLGRSTFKGKSGIANTPLSGAGIDAMIHQLETKLSVGSGSGIILLDSYGGAINRVNKSATAFVHRDALFSMQYLAYWDAAAPADPNLRWLRTFYAAMRPYVSPFAYQNYIDPELPNWQRAYYGANLDRLIAVKRRYDPQNVFRFKQSIPLKKS
jgi:FAD/FMN-containing dehydrogenase